MDVEQPGIKLCVPSYYPVYVFNTCSARDLPFHLSKPYFIPDLFKLTFCFDVDLESHEKAFILENEKELIHAALAGNCAKLRSLLSAGVSVDAAELNKVLFYASRNYMTPLQIAAARGYFECVKLLIKYNADVDAKDRFHVTAMHMAAQEGNYLCVKALLEAGADCNATTKYSRKGCYTAIPYLGGTTPLHLAAANDRVYCITELIRHGADYNAIDELGRTALYIAAQAGFNYSVLAQLRNAVGRDILSLPGFETGDTPLHFAVRQGMIDCVKELLLQGSDVNHFNYAGSSPLHLAVTSRCRDKYTSFEILKLLVLHGYNCDINLTDSSDWTPLHYASFGVGTLLRRRTDMAKFLITYGANVNIANRRGISLIEYEYNSNSDATILLTIVQSMSIPTPLSQLNNWQQVNIPRIVTQNYGNFYAMWFTLRSGALLPSEPETLQVQHLGPANANAMSKRLWYQSVVSSPRPLTHFCRYSIRAAMGCKRLKDVKNLPLPEIIKSYLLFENGEYC